MTEKIAMQNKAAAASNLRSGIERRQSNQTFPYARCAGGWQYIDERKGTDRRAILSSQERDMLLSRIEELEDENDLLSAPPPKGVIYGDAVAILEVQRRIDVLARALRHYATGGSDTIVAKVALQDCNIPL